MIEAACTNISIGGMKVSTDKPRPRGSLVRFDLEIEPGISIRGLGEVVWMRAETQGPGREAGMGIKFRFIEQRDRQLIYKIVSEHIKERLAHKHPPLEELAGTGDLPEAPETAGSQIPAAGPPFVGAATAPEESPEPLLPSLHETGPLELEDSFPASSGSSEAAEPPAGYGYGSASSAFSFDEPLDDVSEEADLGERRYKVNELYHPRPARRRDFPVIPVVLLLLLVGVVIVYVYWDDLVGPASPPVETPQAVSTQAAAGEVPEPGPSEGPSESPADEEPPLSIATDEPPDSGSRTGPARTPPPEPPPELPPPEPPPPEPPPPPPQVRPFTRVVDVSWTRTPGGVKIEIETDGSIPQERFSHFRLEGDSPREVVKLTGVVRQFDRGTIPVRGSPVSQIRIGYHPGPRELHVVLDMLDRSTRITRLRSQGSKLEVYLE